MTPEFWKVFQFGLECAIPNGGTTQHTLNKINEQSKYTWEDVHYIIFPVLSKFDMTVTSCSYLTSQGCDMLALLQRGESPPPLPNKMIEIHSIRASYADTEEDCFYNDEEGYMTFFKAMCNLEAYCPFIGYEWYLWTQIHCILQGEKPVVYAILVPFFEPSVVLEDFLTKHLSKGEDGFRLWYIYAESNCPK